MNLLSPSGELKTIKDIKQTYFGGLTSGEKTMGIYLNPGKQRFQIAMNSEIFVDKTGMIRYLNSIVNTNQRYISVSRPRRFGKTMAADMLCAYYDRTADSRDMFEKTIIASTQGWDSLMS